MIRLWKRDLQKRQLLSDFGGSYFNHLRSFSQRNRTELCLFGQLSVDPPRRPAASPPRSASKSVNSPSQIHLVNLRNFRIILETIAESICQDGLRPELLPAPPSPFLFTPFRRLRRRYHSLTSLLYPPPLLNCLQLKRIVNRNLSSEVYAITFCFRILICVFCL